MDMVIVKKDLLYKKIVVIKLCKIYNILEMVQSTYYLTNVGYANLFPLYYICFFQIASIHSITNYFNQIKFFFIDRSTSQLRVPRLGAVRVRRLRNDWLHGARAGSTPVTRLKFSATITSFMTKEAVVANIGANLLALTRRGQHLTNVV